MSIPANNVFTVARSLKEGSLIVPEAFHRVFRVHHDSDVSCHVSPELSSKYKLPVVTSLSGPGRGRNDQEIVGISNRVLGEQVWFNKQRTQKPQTFASDGAVVDPTNNGERCDFCRWETLTAEDAFPRVERPHAVSASNLFKYGIQHGVIILKRHDPLAFTEPELSDLLLVSAEWFRRAHAERPECAHPLFIWNTLARSGASQYHPHCQLLLSPEPFPMEERLARARDRGGDVLGDLLEAHRALGLVQAVQAEGTTAHLIASFCPFKDMEVQIMADSMTTPAFCRALFVALRALIDRLGSRTFNVGILNLNDDSALPFPASTADGRPQGPIFARVMSRGKLSSAASDFGGLEVMAGASIGHSDPFVVFDALVEQLALVTQAESPERAVNGLN